MDQPAPKPPSKQRQRDDAAFAAWLNEYAANDGESSPEKTQVPATDDLADVISEPAALTVPPREYQNELFERAKQKNTIVVLDTGSGKTLIAIMLLRHALERELDHRAAGRPRKTSFFVVDKVALCIQQYLVIRANLPFPITRLFSDTQPIQQERAYWDAQFEENMIIVCTAQILLDCLDNGFIAMAQINLLIFDEVHHSKKNHPYANIMKRYYPRNANVEDKPRILGLTASPVDTQDHDLETAAEQLESIMCSEIATVTDDVMAASWMRRERAERTLYYAPLKGVEESYTPLTKQIEGEYAQHVSPLRRHVMHAVEIGSTLGPWCADRFWQALLTDSAMKSLALQSGRNGKVDFSYDQFDSASDSLKTLKPLLSQHEFSRLPTEDGAISSKLTVLREELLAAFKENQATRCIVFVETQFTAMMLAEYFSQPGVSLPGMMADFMVGLGRGNTITSVPHRDRLMRLENFRQGETNCLFATSVAEEGLDIPACDLVIRFDVCSSPIQYIQSRGRARKPSSVYITMMEEDNLKHTRLHLHVTRGAQTLRTFCQNLPPDRKIGLYERPSEAEFAIADGATLSKQNSMTVLAKFVSSLAQGNNTSPVPEYVLSGAGSNFVCWVILPDSAPIKSATGSIQRSKIRARAAAAYEGCIRLIQMGFINKHLQPTFRKKLPAMRNARLALSSKKQKEYNMLIKPKIWTSLPAEPPLVLYPTYIQFEPVAHLAPMAILTRDALPECGPINLFTAKDTVTMAILTGGQPVTISLTQVQMLSSFTVQVFAEVFSKHFDAKLEEMPYFLAPFTAQDAGSVEHQIQWELLEQIISTKEWRPTDVDRRSLARRFIVDHLDGSRKFITGDINGYLRADDPTPVDAPDSKCRGYILLDGKDKTIMQYSCSARPQLRMKLDLDPSYPVYNSVLLSLRRNFLTDAEMENMRGDQPCPITLQYLKVSSMPANIACSALLLPSILFRIDITLIVAEATELLGLKLPIGLAMEAFTKTTVDVDDEEAVTEAESHGVARNYERLEFLGDTFLKLATTIALYTRNPSASEFEHHVERMLLVCNKNLFNTALDLGLQSYIRSAGFDRRTWYPDLPLLQGKRAKSTVLQSLADKTIADVCEAVIGAAYMSGADGDMDEAVRAVSKVVNHENHNMQSFAEYYTKFTIPKWHLSEASASVRAAVDRVESTVDYRFHSPLLLRSAFTHPSYKAEEIPNYQTLEFLGDALLDMAVVDHLFRTHPDAGPQWLTENKMAVCGNQFLGCLCVSLDLQREILCANASVPGQISAFEAKLQYLQEKQKAETPSSDSSPNPPSHAHWTQATKPPKLLADVMEALLGAMFVDSGYDYTVITRFFARFVQPYLDTMDLTAALGPGHVVTEAAHHLQEELGCRRWRFCVSEVPCESGAGRAALTETDCVCAMVVHGQVAWHAKGSSGTEAKSRVARMALEAVRDLDRATYQREMRCDCAA